MKVKKDAKQHKQKIIGAKNIKIKLTRLSLNTINKYKESSAELNCQLYLHIKDGKVLQFKDAGTKIPMTITVNAIIPTSASQSRPYSLRTKIPKKEEKKQKKVCSTVAVIGAAARKNQLWSLAKKARNMTKLVVDAVVFGKQVITQRNLKNKSSL